MNSATTESGGCLARLHDYYILTKPEVNLLILMTTSAGYYLGLHGPFHLARFLETLIGTLMVASGTATLNQWMEKKWDAQMRRTARRPLPAGRISSSEALALGVLLSVAGGILLYSLVNPISSWLAISTLLSYLIIYTPLKRLTPFCTMLGAVPGAMPTLIGWSAASGTVSWEAVFLFGILFLWQFPHFLAIAIMYREDYDRAGYRMLPRFDAETRFTRTEIVVFTCSLIAMTLFPVLTHTGIGYFTAMLLAGGFLLYHSLKLARSGSRAVASRLVHASVVYLPFVLTALVLTKR